MKYFITGANGQLGYDVNKQLLQDSSNEILAVDIDVLDLTNQDSVEKMVLEFKPDVIVHCAAYTAVDLAEDDFDKCYDVNVNATKYLVDCAKKLDAKFIYISTDYVFEGTKDGIYEINDETKPVGAYGKTKLLGEKEVDSYDKAFIVRISWVFGINGNNFIKTMLRLSETRDELGVVCDQIGSPTYTFDLAKLLVEMSKTSKYGIYHATNEEFCSWADFAKYVFEVTNKNVKVNGILTKDYPTRAYRPANSKLSKQSLIDNGFSLLPTWKDAVDRYILELENKGE